MSVYFEKRSLGNYITLFNTTIATEIDSTSEKLGLQQLKKLEIKQLARKKETLKCP